MENPWKNFVHKSPFILEEDRGFIEHFNEQIREYYEIQVDQPPAPFVGNKNAPIVLLNLNPGYKEDDNEFYKKEAFIKASENNLTHRSNEYPFYFLDPSLGRDNSGYKWWHKKLKELISEFKEKAVSQNILVLEYFPYHSKRFYFSKCVYSHAQEYTKFLLEKAMERNVLVIIMRSKKIWYEFVPKLEKYKNHCVLNSCQNPAVSRKNMPDGWFDKIRNKFYC